jgi:hypothetical protein
MEYAQQCALHYRDQFNVTTTQHKLSLASASEVTRRYEIKFFTKFAINSSFAGTERLLPDAAPSWVQVLGDSTDETVNIHSTRSTQFQQLTCQQKCAIPL